MYPIGGLQGLPLHSSILIRKARNFSYKTLSVQRVFATQKWLKGKYASFSPF